MNEQEKFLLLRTQKLESYSQQEPIFVYLRQLKTKESDVFEQLLFYFGEMDESDRTHRHTVWWSQEKKKFTLIKKGFYILCPKGYFETGDCEYGSVSFRFHWCDDGDMNPIVFDKIIFPDFCCVNKKCLEF